MFNRMDFRSVFIYKIATEQKRQHSTQMIFRKFKRMTSLLPVVAFILLSSFLSRAQPLAVDSAFLYNLDIKFEGSDVHIDGNYQYILDNFVEYFLAHPEIAIHIRGHVCCRPGKRISRQRARNVYRFLMANGIDKSRMTYAGYSDTMPLASPERTEEDERVNRRVDFILTPKK
jgi:outer membrane protein OmpA-like peptidoglycan-associated protein